MSGRESADDRVDGTFQSGHGVGWIFAAVVFTPLRSMFEMNAEGHKTARLALA